MSTKSSEVLLSLEDICKYFKVSGGTLKAVDHVTFDIHKGETVGLVGESGCGKSTLGRVAMGIYPPTFGKLSYKGKEVNLKHSKDRFAYAKKAQIIFQDPYASLDPRMTVSSIIEEGMVIHKMYDEKRRKERVYELLEMVGLNREHANRLFSQNLALLVVIVISDKLKKDKPVLSPAEKKAANRQLWLGGLCCGAALAMASNFQQAGMVAGTDSGKAGFLTALYVVLVPVCGLFFKRKVSLPVWIAVALSVIALYLLCINGEFSLAPGDLLILACAVCFTIHILVIDHFTATVDGVKLSCLQFLFAALISTVCMFLFEDVDFAAIWGCILPLLYVGIFSCGVGYTLQILAQKGSNPTVVTILLSLESVFAVIAGAIILKQQMSAREYIGCAVMFAAVLLAQIDFPVKQKAE